MTTRWVAGTAAAIAVAGVTALTGAGMGHHGTVAMREIVHVQAAPVTAGYGADTGGAIIVQN
jgi:hypothetical protein